MPSLCFKPLSVCPSTIYDRDGAGVPESFVDDVLWPQYEALSRELREYLDQATEKIISEEIHQDTTEAQEIVQLLEAD